MTPIDRARQLTWNPATTLRSDLDALIAGAITEEREACAKLVETEDFSDDPRRVFKQIAAAIRGQ